MKTTSLYFTTTMLSVLLASSASAAPRVKPSDKASAPAETPLCGIHLLPKRDASKRAPNKGVVFVPQTEVEPNNSVGTANSVSLGRGSGQSAAFNLNGNLASSISATPFTTNAEPNGSINLATPTGLTPGNLGFVKTSSSIASTPSTGDFDMFSVQALSGQEIYIETLANASSSLDPVVAVWNSVGDFETFDNDSGAGNNSLLRFRVPANGTYFISIESVGNNFSDPFDPNSGQGTTGIGNYEMVFGLNNIMTFPTAAEDNGSIPLATITGITGSTPGTFQTSSTISATPATGDYDHFAVQALRGQTLRIETLADSASSLDTYMLLRDAAGNVLAEDDDAGIGSNSLIQFTVPADGTYYIGIEDYNSIQGDSFNSNSGSGVGNTGDYSLFITLVDVSDEDFFQINIGAGELLTIRSNSSAVTGITVYNGSGAPRFTSFDPVNDFITFPNPNPILTGGSPSLSTILETAGTYYVSFTGSQLGGAYDVDVAIAAPGLIDQPNGTKQILFLDFDGATNFDASFLGGNSNTTLSPLSTFLPEWSLSPSDENAVIDAIIAVVQDRMVTDFINSGLNGDFNTTGTPGEFALEIRNSRDHADPFGQPNVSRIIIGGTIAESGINTIGIAESIDVGNYETEETALVLLDVLSDATGGASVNTYAVGPSFTKIQAVGRAVGLVTAHEAGHFFGCWHTENTNSQPEIMDQGGNAAQLFGVGSDSIWGTADDFQTRFGVDQFNAAEAVYQGNENTQGILTFGLSTGANGIFNNPAQVDNWFVY